MNVERFDELLELELDGNLAEADRALLNSMCDADAALAEVRRADLQMVEMLRSVGPAHPPRALALDIMAKLNAPAVEAEPESPAPAHEPVGASSHRFESGRSVADPWWSRLFAAPALRFGFAAAVVCIFGYMGLITVQQSRERGEGLMPELTGSRIFNGADEIETGDAPRSFEVARAEAPREDAASSEGSSLSAIPPIDARSQVDLDDVIRIVPETEEAPSVILDAQMAASPSMDGEMVADAGEDEVARDQTSDILRMIDELGQSGNYDGPMANRPAEEREIASAPVGEPEPRLIWTAEDIRKELDRQQQAVRVTPSQEFGSAVTASAPASETEPRVVTSIEEFRTRMRGDAPTSTSPDRNVASAPAPRSSFAASPTIELEELAPREEAKKTESLTAQLTPVGAADAGFQDSPSATDVKRGLVKAKGSTTDAGMNNVREVEKLVAKLDGKILKRAPDASDPTKMRITVSMTPTQIKVLKQEIKKIGMTSNDQTADKLSEASAADDTSAAKADPAEEPIQFDLLVKIN